MTMKTFSSSSSVSREKAMQLLLHWPIRTNNGANQDDDDNDNAVVITNVETRK